MNDHGDHRHSSTSDSHGMANSVRCCSGTRDNAAQWFCVQPFQAGWHPVIQRLAGLSPSPAELF